MTEHYVPPPKRTFAKLLLVVGAVLTANLAALAALQKKELRHG